MSALAIQNNYERLRRHGLGHEQAIAVLSDGSPLYCWCGSDRLCDGGALRMVGCPVDIGFGAPHVRHRGDCA